MSEKKIETSKKWRLRFTWTDGLARASIGVTITLPLDDPASISDANPVAMIASIADQFKIPLAKCSEASAERVEWNGDDDNPF